MLDVIIPSSDCLLVCITIWCRHACWGCLIDVSNKGWLEAYPPSLLFLFWSLNGWALIRVFWESIYIFSCHGFMFWETHEFSWCILRCWDDDSMSFYFMNPLQLFYDYDDIMIIWINDGVTPWTFVIICWCII